MKMVSVLVLDRILSETTVFYFNNSYNISLILGIAELDIPISDKHLVDHQDITIGSDLITLKISFTNLTISGMAQSTITGVK